MKSISTITACSGMGSKEREKESAFHDHDETWLILKGKGTGYWIDYGGQRTEFELEAGDVWSVPVGFEHGSDGFPGTGKNSEDFTIAVFNGALPPGSHNPGHYYTEKEGYIPSFVLQKTPTDRYRAPLNLPAKMKGLMFVEKGKAALIDEDTPGCAAGTVLCKTLFTGLTNGTERNVLVGGNYGGNWPGRCGYQNVGRVLAVGVGVKGYAVGDIIFTGDFQQHRQYFAAPVGPENLIVKLPNTVNPKHAALFGVAGVAMHDVRRAAVKLGERVLVVGAGPIGQCTAQAARIAGAVVTVCDLDAERLAVAASLGAHHTLVPDAKWENVKAQGPFDCVIEDSGGPVLDSVIGVGWENGVIKHNGRVVIIAGRNRVDYNFNAGQSYELCIYHAGHFVIDDLREVCRACAESTIKFAPIIRDVVKYKDMIAIYDRLRDKPSSLFGVVFDWE